MSFIYHLDLIHESTDMRVATYTCLLCRKTKSLWFSYVSYQTVLITCKEGLINKITVRQVYN